MSRKSFHQVLEIVLKDVPLSFLCSSSSHSRTSSSLPPPSLSSSWPLPQSQGHQNAPGSHHIWTHSADWRANVTTVTAFMAWRVKQDHRDCWCSWVWIGMRNPVQIKTQRKFRFWNDPEPRRNTEPDLNQDITSWFSEDNTVTEQNPKSFQTKTQRWMSSRTAWTSFRTKTSKRMNWGTLTKSRDGSTSRTNPTARPSSKSKSYSDSELDQIQIRPTNLQTQGTGPHTPYLSRPNSAQIPHQDPHLCSEQD